MRFAAKALGALAATSPDRRRVNLDDLRSSKWRLPARSCMIFPEPVTRKRFFAPLWVFIFGIYLPPVDLLRNIIFAPPLL
jgi:hypothetical protein